MAVVPAERTLSGASDDGAQAKDDLRNKRLCGGDVFAVRLNGPESIEGLVVDNDDGTYTVNYTATVAGKYQLAITDGALHHLITAPGLGCHLDFLASHRCSVGSKGVSRLQVSMCKGCSQKSVCCVAKVPLTH